MDHRQCAVPQAHKRPLEEDVFSPCPLYLDCHPGLLHRVFHRLPLCAQRLTFSLNFKDELYIQLYLSRRDRVSTNSPLALLTRLY